MVDPYLPGAVIVDLGPDGGPYDETANRKGCIHTTEGGSLSGAEQAYRDYPPHIGYDPVTRELHQYIRLDRHSEAFRGSESDDEAIIQVEIVGFANDTPYWPDDRYRNIGRDLIAPLRQAVGIPDTYLRFYGPDEGIVLASANSPIRLSDAELRAYSGWLGHQHIPAPDEHWDPGRFNMGLALTYSEDDMELTEPSAVPKPDGSGTYYTNGEIQFWDNKYINDLVSMVPDIAASLARLEEMFTLPMVGTGQIVLSPAVPQTSQTRRVIQALIRALQTLLSDRR